MDIYSSYDSIQIITPFVIGPHGTKRINSIVHRMIHGTSDICPGTKIVTKRTTTDVKTGAPITSGSYGTVTDCHEKYLTCKLNDGRIVNLSGRDVEMAYAITAYSAQGGEWDYVIAIIPSPDSLRKGFLKEELINTMLTRARIKTFLCKE